MAYVIYGAGAIGGIIAARLQQQGKDVTLIARGKNREALAANGLRLQAENEDWCEPVRVVASPREAGLTSSDIMILGMKTQDSFAAIQELAASAPADMPIFCAQNGVENERMALRHFHNVYAMYVFVFGAHLHPGVVQCFTAPSSGVLDIGRYPGSLDEVTHRVAADLTAAGFDSIERADVMRWKYTKLLANLGNSLAACFGALSGVNDLFEAAIAEGHAAYRAAGVDYVPIEQSMARYKTVMPLKLVEGAPFPGGSAWQSLARGAGQTEVDYLTGEIVLLGRLHGVATPLNTALQQLVQKMVTQNIPVGTLDPAEVRALLPATSTAKAR